MRLNMEMEDDLQGKLQLLVLVVLVMKEEARTEREKG